MRILICSACRTKVMPTQAGFCPACQAPFEDWADRRRKNRASHIWEKQNGAGREDSVAATLKSTLPQPTSAPAEKETPDAGPAPTKKKGLVSAPVDLMRLKKRIHRELHQLEQRILILQRQRFHLTALERSLARRSNSIAMKDESFFAAQG